MNKKIILNVFMFLILTSMSFAYIIDDFNKPNGQINSTSINNLGNNYFSSGGFGCEYSNNISLCSLNTGETKNNLSINNTDDFEFFSSCQSIGSCNFALQENNGNRLLEVLFDGTINKIFISGTLLGIKGQHDTGINYIDNQFYKINLIANINNTFDIYINNIFIFNIGLWDITKGGTQTLNDLGLYSFFVSTIPSTMKIDNISVNGFSNVIINTPPIINSITPNITQIIKRGQLISFNLNITDNENDSITNWYLNDTLVSNNSLYVFDSITNKTGLYEVYSNVFDSEFSVNSSKVLVNVTHQKMFAFHDFTNDNLSNYFDISLDNDIILTQGVFKKISLGKYGSALRSFFNSYSLYNTTFLKNKNQTFGYWFKFASTGNAPVLNSGLNSCEILNSDYICNDNIIINNISSSVWYHVVFVYNEESQINKIYLNGVVIYTTPSTNSFLSGDIIIGNISFSKNIYIDDLFIYEGALNKNSINDIMINSSNYNNLVEELSFQQPLNVVITKPNESYVLNSSGVNIPFIYTNSGGNPNPLYDVYLKLGFIDYPIRLNTSLTNFVESVDSSQIPITNNYTIKVIASNIVGNTESLSSYEINICINNWVEQLTPCVNDTQIKTYNDTNSCFESYDVPNDNNSIVACDDGLFSSTEIILLQEENKNNRAFIYILLIVVILIFLFQIMGTKEPMFSIALAVVNMILLSIGLVLIRDLTLSNSTLGALSNMQPIFIVLVVLQLASLLFSFIQIKNN